jgi:hypothetical protein
MTINSFNAVAEDQEVTLFSRTLKNGELRGESALLEKPEKTAGILSNLITNTKVIKDNGPSSNRVDLVFLGDGYTTGDSSKFDSQVVSISDGLFQQMPLSEYKNYFNLHQVFSPSVQSGIDNDGQLGIDKNTVLNGKFYCQDVKENICVDVSIAWELAAQARDFDQISVLVNSSSDGGTAYPFSDISVVPGGNGLVASNLAHQVGHSFANLADEYDNGSWPTYTGFEPAEPNVSAQNTEAMLTQKLKWHQWLSIDSGANFGGIINTYEGAMGHKYSIYRPTENSKMRNLNAPFNNPSIESFIKEIYKKVKPIDNATSVETPLTGSSVISVTPLQPIGRNLTIQWYVDNTPIAGANAKTFRPNDYPISDGMHAISVEVSDDTPLLKDEAFRTQYMKEKRTWNVPIDQNAPIITKHPASVSVFIGATTNLSVTAIGEDLKYQWFKNGVKIDGATQTSYLTPGAIREKADYYVEVSNVQGTLRSNTATVSIKNRLPAYSGSTSLTLSRLEEKEIAFEINDEDGDSLSSVYTIEAATNTGVTVSLASKSLKIKASSAYLGQFSIKLNFTDSYDTISIPISVNVVNNAPVIDAINDLTRLWTTDKASVEILASDNDSMDTVSLSANLATGFSAPVSLSMNGKVLNIDPQAGYYGKFNVTVRATDGFTNTFRTFSVNWANDSPVIDQVAPIRSHYKVDKIIVPINATDPNGDTLQLSASILPINNLVTASLSGKTLTIDPSPTYRGASTLRVTASDSALSSVMNTSLEIYNNAPVIAPISATNVNQNKKSVSIPVSISDPDPEDSATLTSSVRLLTSGASGVQVKLENNNLIVESSQNFSVPLLVEVKATDGDLTAVRNVYLSVLNTAPLLTNIDEQFIHPIKEDIRTIDLIATDIDNDSITYTAEVVKPNAKAPTLSVSGNKLSINTINDFLGSFTIRVIASDGLSEVAKTFKVTTYNTDPELNAICDRSAPATKFPIEIPLIASDPDKEDLTFEGKIERNSLPFLLKAKYNFDAIRFRPSNGLGLGEKYVSGYETDPDIKFWYYILPNGDLYRLNKTHKESQFLLKLPAGYYENPDILINGDISGTILNAFSISFEGSKLKVALSRAVQGSVQIRVRAKDYFSFNEKSFILTVTEGRLKLDDVPDMNIHWKEEPRSGSLIAKDPVTGLTPDDMSYDVAEFDGSLAKSLDDQYNFHVSRNDQYDAQIPPDNFTNRGEKYIRAYKISYLNNVPSYAGIDVFAILPNGDLYLSPPKAQNTQYYSLENATLIAELDKVYYRDTSLLINAASGAGTNLIINGDNTSFTVEQTPGFLGKVILEARAWKGIASDSKTFIVNIYDNEPTLNVPLNCDEFGCKLIRNWKTNEIRLPITLSDVDPLDSVTSKAFETDPSLNPANSASEYSLKWNHKNGQFDRDGWREIHFAGTYQNSETDIALTTDGKLYKWNGNPQNSILLTQVPSSFHELGYTLDSSVNTSKPSLLNHPEVRVEGSELVITPKANTVINSGIIGWASDGMKRGFLKFPVFIINQQPQIGAIADKTVHWRDNLITENILVSDPDGDTVSNLNLTINPISIDPAIDYNLTNLVLTLKSKFGYLGTYSSTIFVTDQGNLSSARSFNTTVFNTAPVLESIGNKDIDWNMNTLEIPFTMSDADANDSDKLISMVFNGSASDFTDFLVNKHKFTKTGAGATNSLGLSEVHFKGTVENQSREFIVLPSEAIYLVSGTNLEIKGFLAPGTYSNPNRLLSIVNPNFAPKHSVSTDGTKIILSKSSGLTEPIIVTAWATDTIQATSETFTVNIIDNAPVLPELATSYERHWRPGLLELPNFPSIDEEGETINYQVTSSPAGLQHSISSSILSVKPTNANQIGNYTVNIVATSGSKSSSKSFSYNLTNGAPSIAPLGAQTVVGYKESYSQPFTATDPNSDPLTYTTSLVGPSPSNFLVAVAGSTIKVSPKTPLAGTYTINLKASDGPSSADASTQIIFQNRAPTFNVPSAMDIPWKTKVGSQTLVFSDPDDDTLTLTPTISDPTVATAVISGNKINIDLKKYAPSFIVKIRLSDGANSIDREFPVSVSNLKPTLTGLPPTKDIHWNTNSFTQSFTVADANNDTLTVTSKILNNTVPASVTITNSLATIDVTEKKMGELNLNIKVADDVSSTEGNMKVTFTNTKPKISEIANQIISTGIEKTLELEASDANSDELTLSAIKMSLEEVAFDLDKMFNFEQGETNFGFNKLGNNEKYLRGSDPVRKTPLNFVIYPNGRLYIWTGILTNSTFLGSIPTELHANPTLLINAIAPNASNISYTASITGSTLKLKAINDFEGTFWIRAAATDTQELAPMYFRVNSYKEVTSGGGTDPKECETKETEHDGECSQSGKSMFTAEGRIGDTVTGAGNRTFELDIGKSTSGPFASGQTSNHIWVSGKKESFSITFDPINKVCNFVLGGKTVVYKITEDVFSLSDILIRTRRGNTQSSMKIDSLKINGKTISNSVYADGNSNQVRTLQIRSVKELKDKFTLEGAATMIFSSDVKNSELAFQISFTKSDNAPETCEDSDEDDHDDDDSDHDDEDDNDDDDSNSRKVKICHYPPGNTSNPQTITVSKSSLSAHLAHGDVIGECPGDPQDPGTGEISCEAKQLFASPNYTLWNSFLNMINILELTNSTANPIPVKISFFSILGELAHERTIVVPATNQFDVIINDFPGFVKDSYGVVKLEFTGNLDGRMSFYRPTTGLTSYDYAYSIPLADANFGTTAISFNTFQPSQKPSELNNLVANWLSIVNLDSATQKYSVFTYDMSGKLILRRELEIPSFGRADVDGGHGLAGPNVVGYHKVIPYNVTAEYIAQITRFGGNAAAGFAPSAYKFAFPLSAKLGASDPIYVPISNKFGESNWIEVVNILDQTVQAAINYYSIDGRLLESADAYIPGNAQIHFNASAQLASGETGYAVVVPSTPYSIVAQSMGYLREQATGSVTSVYGSQARRAVPCVQSGAYNLYLNMQNWLLVANTTNDTIKAVVKFTGPNLASQKSLTLAPRASVYLPIHGNTEIGAKADTYGLIAVYPEDSSLRLFSEVMRLKYKADGSPDFSMPVPVR